MAGHFTDAYKSKENSSGSSQVLYEKYKSPSLHPKGTMGQSRLAQKSEEMWQILVRIRETRNKIRALDSGVQRERENTRGKVGYIVTKFQLLLYKP